MSGLAPLLERYYGRFDAAAHIPRDPIQFPHRCARPEDIEAVAFIAASLAFGRVASFGAVLDFLLERLGEHPAEVLREASRGSTPARARVHAAAATKYRWLESAELEALLLAVGSVLAEGSLEDHFLRFEGNTWSALEGFLGDLRARAAAAHPAPQERSRALAFLFPSTRTAACKRQHLFLRWMVRPDREGADFGLWTRVSPASLVMPCDVHTARIGHALGLCSRPKASRRTANELTVALRRIDAEDPVRFDFALCHLGISGGCRGRRIEAICGGCDLREACRWW